MADKDDKLERECLTALVNWIRESSNRGLPDHKVVTMLLSETVRTYRIVHHEKTSAASLIEWITRVFHDNAAKAKPPEKPPKKPDGYGSN